MDKKEFKIGEVVTLGLLKLKCVPAKEAGYCDGCFFQNRHCYSDIMGDCNPDLRENKDSVIFVKVEE